MPSLTHPVRDPARRVVTQRFGENPDYYARWGLRGHNGIDYGCALGSEIQACDDGTVLEAVDNGTGDYGCYLKLGHAWGESLHAHLTAGSLRVLPGWMVKRGQALALSGSTGNSTGPHLHFAIRLNPYSRGDGWNGFSNPEPYLMAETAQQTLLTWHFQNRPDGHHQDLVRSARPAWVKRMDPDELDLFPGIQTLGRVYMDDSQANAMVGQGAAGGEAWFRYCLPTYRKAGYIRHWEFANETPVNDIEYNRRLAGAIIRWTELMHAEGLLAIGPVISEGNPGGEEAERRARMQALGPAFRVVDGWAYHAYWLPTGPDIWHTYRYRMNVQYLAEIGIPPLPLYISESGIDGAIMGQPHKGWISLSNLSAFWSQCQEVERECLKDPYVRCITLFSGAPNPDWQDFSTDGDPSRLMAEHVSAGAPVDPPGPEPEPPAPVASVEESIREFAWEQMFPGKIKYTPTFAFPRFASSHDLGCPMTAELRLAVGGTTYALQGFARAIAYCPDGAWDAIRDLDWS